MNGYEQGGLTFYLSRAVDTRFEVPAESDRDIIATIERWQMRQNEAA